jgi:hypothetical protein
MFKFLIKYSIGLFFNLLCYLCILLKNLIFFRILTDEILKFNHILTMVMTMCFMMNLAVIYISLIIVFCLQILFLNWLFLFLFTTFLLFIFLTSI